MTTKNTQIELLLSWHPRIELQLNLTMKHVVELMYQEVAESIERQVELVY